MDLKPRLIIICRSLSQRFNNMAKYGPKAQQEVKEAMHEFKRGELKTSHGQKVTKRSQAVAIGLSEAREEGAKIPPPPKKK